MRVICASLARYAVLLCNVHFALYVTLCDICVHVSCSRGLHNVLLWHVRVMCASLCKLRFIVHVKSTRLSSCVMYILLRTFRRVIYVFRAHVDYITFCYGMCALCVLRYVSYAL